MLTFSPFVRIRSLNIIFGDHKTNIEDTGLASELLINRYQMPPPNDPNSILAQHEASVFSEARSVLQHSAKGAHRSEQFNRDILPLALPLIEAVGHRMAYEAAQQAGIDQKILDLYESGVIKQDSAWYTEQGGLSREIQREMEAQAADALIPELVDIMRDSGMQEYCTAPMTSKDLWDGFVSGQEVFDGDADASLLV